MVKLLSAFALSCIYLSPHGAKAWGPEGHLIVAEIAQAELRPEIREKVMVLLRTEKANSLGDIANWADSEREAVKSGKIVDYPMPSHVTRLPLDQSMDLGRSCPNFCAVKAIDYYAARLSDKNLSDQEREIALKFVVHLVGDLHQPLHSSYKVGNFTPVSFMGKRRTLHWVWDVGILQAQNKPRDALIEEIMQARVKDGGAALQWALEGRNIARDQIFPNLGKQDVRILPPDYAVHYWPAIKTRLKLAGIRLARLLNDCLAG